MSFIELYCHKQDTTIIVNSSQAIRISYGKEALKDKSDAFYISFHMIHGDEQRVYYRTLKNMNDRLENVRKALSLSEGTSSFKHAMPTARFI